MESLLGNASDIISIAGALKAMNNDDDGRVLALPGLPMAMSEQAGLRINLKKSGLGRRYVEPSGHESRDDSHCVAVLQKRVRFKGREDEIHIETVFHGLGASKTKASTEFR